MSAKEINITYCKRGNNLNFPSENDSHLGNVLAVIADAWYIDTCIEEVGIRYAAQITQATDYSAFGAPLPGRTWYSGKEYRQGFNGKEKDSETELQDYGMRIYNPAIAKFLSVDPIARDYPWVTPYAFAENEPIDCIDLDGLEKWIVTEQVVNGVTTYRYDYNPGRSPYVDPNGNTFDWQFNNLPPNEILAYGNGPRNGNIVDQMALSKTLKNPNVAEVFKLDAPKSTAPSNNSSTNNSPTKTITNEDVKPNSSPSSKPPGSGGHSKNLSPKPLKTTMGLRTWDSKVMSESMEDAVNTISKYVNNNKLKTYKIDLTIFCPKGKSYIDTHIVWEGLNDDGKPNSKTNKLTMTQSLQKQLNIVTNSVYKKTGAKNTGVNIHTTSEHGVKNLTIKP